MPKLVVLFIALFYLQTVNAQLIAGTQITGSSKLKDYNGKTYTVKPSGRSVAYVFISTECPLCKNYAPVLQALQDKYKDVQFYGIVSGITFSRPEVATFTKEYGIKFPVLMDPSKKISAAMNATVTPEVILLNEDGKEYYRGLIDDWVVSLGKTRRVTSKRYLDQAIYSMQKGGPAVAATTPIGCLICNF